MTWRAGCDTTTCDMAAGPHDAFFQAWGGAMYVNNAPSTVEVRNVTFRYNVAKVGEVDGGGRRIVCVL